MHWLEYFLLEVLIFTLGQACEGANFEGAGTARDRGLPGMIREVSPPGPVAEELGTGDSAVEIKGLGGREALGGTGQVLSTGGGGAQGVQYRPEGVFAEVSTTQ